MINWVYSFIIKQPNRERNPLLMLYKSTRKNTVLYLLVEDVTAPVTDLVRGSAKPWHVYIDVASSTFSSSA